LFDLSIQDNIAYGDNLRDNIPIQEIIQAAKKADIHEFIESLADVCKKNCVLITMDCVNVSFIGI
jgi:ABC-type multidrug transport system fused ATPase/permease subunit